MRCASLSSIPPPRNESRFTNTWAEWEVGRAAFHAHFAVRLGGVGTLCLQRNSLHVALSGCHACCDPTSCRPAFNFLSPREVDLSSFFGADGTRAGSFAPRVVFAFFRPVIQPFVPPLIPFYGDVTASLCFPQMKLYLRRDVAAYSYKRWGSEDGLEEERNRRDSLKFDRSLSRTKVCEQRRKQYLEEEQPRMSPENALVRHPGRGPAMLRVSNVSARDWHWVGFTLSLLCKQRARESSCAGGTRFYWKCGLILFVLRHLLSLHLAGVGCLCFFCGTGSPPLFQYFHSMCLP